MRYEISCFIRSPSTADGTADIQDCVKLFEALLARSGAEFTIELRDLKEGNRLYQAVRHGAADDCAAA